MLGTSVSGYYGRSKGVCPRLNVLCQPFDAAGPRTRAQRLQRSRRLRALADPYRLQNDRIRPGERQGPGALLEFLEIQNCPSYRPIIVGRHTNRCPGIVDIQQLVRRLGGRQEIHIASERGQDITQAEEITSVNVSNVLNEEKKKQVIALGQLGWALGISAPSPDRISRSVPKYNLASANRTIEYGRETGLVLVSLSIDNQTQRSKSCQ
jgi:hypothetical protein